MADEAYVRYAIAGSAGESTYLAFPVACQTLSVEGAERAADRSGRIDARR